jgi:hypothetical protein
MCYDSSMQTLNFQAQRATSWPVTAGARASRPLHVGQRAASGWWRMRTTCTCRGPQRPPSRRFPSVLLPPPRLACHPPSPSVLHTRGRRTRALSPLLSRHCQPPREAGCHQHPPWIEAFVEADARSRAAAVETLVTSLMSFPLPTQDKFLLLRSSS